MTKIRAVVVSVVALLLMAQTSPPATRPGGSTTQVQFNNGGTFGGDAGMTYIAGTNTLTIDNVVATLLNGIAPADFARLSQSNVFTGQIQTVRNATPYISIDETDAAADERNSFWRASAGALLLCFAPDATPDSCSVAPLQFDRSGTSASSAALAASAISLTGDTTITGTQAVTGLATFDGGGITIDDGGLRETSCSYTTASGTQNNVDIFALCSPAGSHAIVRITPDASVDTTITGIVLANNQRVTIIVGDPGSGLRGIIFSNENASSTATNRILNTSQNSTCTYNRGDIIFIWKDPVSDRVRAGGMGGGCAA